MKMRQNNPKKRVQDLLVGIIGNDCAQQHIPVASASEDRSTDKFSLWAILNDIVDQKKKLELLESH